MKCSSCGANLEIDNAFCPYCGTPNKVAKKHREDLNRFESDYKATKEEVIGNSKRFNLKTFKITVIAVTIAVIALYIPVLAITEGSMRFEYERKEGSKRAEAVMDVLDEFIANDDYLGFFSYTNKNNLYYYYQSPSYKYYYARSTTEAYVNLIESVYYLEDVRKGLRDFRSDNISMYVNQIFNNIKRLGNTYENIPEEIMKYVNDIGSDTELLLETYFGVSHEDAISFAEMTDAQRGILIEEGCKNVLK